jgi:hypothetical protein
MKVHPGTTRSPLWGDRATQPLPSVTSAASRSSVPARPPPMPGRPPAAAGFCHAWAPARRRRLLPCLGARPPPPAWQLATPSTLGPRPCLAVCHPCLAAPPAAAGSCHTWPPARRRRLLPARPLPRLPSAAAPACPPAPPPAVVGGSCLAACSSACHRPPPLPGCPPSLPCLARTQLIF